MHKTTAARWRTPNFHQCGGGGKGKAKVLLKLQELVREGVAPGKVLEKVTLTA